MKTRHYGIAAYLKSLFAFWSGIRLQKASAPFQSHGNRAFHKKEWLRLLSSAPQFGAEFASLLFKRFKDLRAYSFPSGFRFDGHIANLRFLGRIKMYPPRSNDFPFFYRDYVRTLALKIILFASAWLLPWLSKNTPTQVIVPLPFAVSSWFPYFHKQFQSVKAATRSL